MKNCLRGPNPIQKQLRSRMNQFIFVKTLESVNKNEVIHSSLIRPIAKLLVPKNKSQFRLLDDLDSDKWNDYKMNGENFSLYDDKVVYRDSGVVFTLKGDFLSMITD